MEDGWRNCRIARISAVGGMLLSLAGMCAASLGYLTPIQGAIAQEVIDLLSILNSLRMLLPVGEMSDFHLPVSAGKSTEGFCYASILRSQVSESRPGAPRVWQ
jgi:hypothetical protein